MDFKNILNYKNRYNKLVLDSTSIPIDYELMSSDKAYLATTKNQKSILSKEFPNKFKKVKLEINNAILNGKYEVSVTIKDLNMANNIQKELVSTYRYKVHNAQYEYRDHYSLYISWKI